MASTVFSTDFVFAVFGRRVYSNPARFDLTVSQAETAVRYISARPEGQLKWSARGEAIEVVSINVGAVVAPYYLDATKIPVRYQLRVCLAEESDRPDRFVWTEFMGVVLIPLSELGE